MKSEKSAEGAELMTAGWWIIRSLPAEIHTQASPMVAPIENILKLDLIIQFTAWDITTNNN